MEYQSKNYIIVPYCDDGNRGDQALVWETKKIAEKAGFQGTFFMLTDGSTNTSQTESENIIPIQPILKHPSRAFKNKKNSQYSIALKIKWGIVSCFDWLYSYILLKPTLRRLLKPLLSNNTKKILDLFDTSEAVFLKGGGFIHAYGKMTDLYTMYYGLYHINLALSFKKKVFVLPNSAGPFGGKHVMKLIKRTLNKCTLVTARESTSLEMLHKLGINCELFPDLAFGLSSSTSQNDAIKIIRDNNPDYKLVAITARPYRFPESVWLTLSKVVPCL
jgi:colanic acid/amylovoran biosynthesis protein